MSNQTLIPFDQLAAARQTIKVMSDQPFPCTSNRTTIDRLLACAGWAPFHRACASEHRQSGSLDGIQPWRFHALDAEGCRQLRLQVLNEPAAGKIPAMLATADSLILVTWLPNRSSEGAVHPESEHSEAEFFDPTLVNVEHIAATSAAIQSLLLAATAAGIRNYWSSGGVLRMPAVLNRLSVPACQRLLGAIFLFPSQIPEGYQAEIATSKLREERSPPSAWSRWVQIAIDA